MGTDITSQVQNGLIDGLHYNNKKYYLKENIVWPQTPADCLSLQPGDFLMDTIRR